MKKLPIYKYLDISTAHISQDTEKFLRRETEDDYGILTAYDTSLGYWVNVPCDLGCLEDDIPNDLMECLKLAEENNCDWIHFDRDAEIIDELETYEW